MINQKLVGWLKELKRRIIAVWTLFSEEQRKQIVYSLSSILNFLFNSVLLAIPLTFIIFHSFSLRQYSIVVLCLWVLLPFFEHYYVWIRESWRDNLPK